MNSYPRLPHSDRKFIRSLHTSRGRDTAQCFIAEGRKLCAELLLSSFHAEAIVLDDAAGEDELRLAGEFSQQGIPVFSIGSSDFAGLCDARTPQSIVAVVEYPENRGNAGGNIVVLDGIADPGNVGTIIRTADWFGFRTVLVGEGCADRFNPKVVRATMGSVFRCHVLETQDLAATIVQDFGGFYLYGAALGGDIALEHCAPQTPFGIVLGSEARGISPAVHGLLSQTFFISGGGAESLNVAVAAGIALYRFSAARL